MWFLLWFLDRKIESACASLQYGSLVSNVAFRHSWNNCYWWIIRKSWGRVMPWWCLLALEASVIQDTYTVVNCSGTADLFSVFLSLHKEDKAFVGRNTVSLLKQAGVMGKDRQAFGHTRFWRRPCISESLCSFYIPPTWYNAKSVYKPCPSSILKLLWPQKSNAEREAELMGGDL